MIGRTSSAQIAHKSRKKRKEDFSDVQSLFSDDENKMFKQIKGFSRTNSCRLNLDLALLKPCFKVQSISEVVFDVSDVSY